MTLNQTIFHLPSKMSRVSLSITIVFFYEHFVNKVRKKETELFFSVSFLLLAIRFHLKYLNLFL